MLFFSFFKTLVGKEVVVEMKNDIEIKGTLHSVDQFLNVKLEDITPINVEFICRSSLLFQIQLKSIRINQLLL